MEHFFCKFTVFYKSFFNERFSCEDRYGGRVSAVGGSIEGLIGEPGEPGSWLNPSASITPSTSGGQTNRTNRSKEKKKNNARIFENTLKTPLVPARISPDRDTETENGKHGNDLRTCRFMLILAEIGLDGMGNI